MNLIKTTIHCPSCGKSFDIELEENAVEDAFLEECPMCGNSIEVHLVLDGEGNLVKTEVSQVDGDSDE